MKFVDEYRDPELARRCLASIAQLVTQPWTVMEICGGQTHSIVKYGIDQLLPHDVTLVHGPGCPVCVTPVSMIDKAIEIALLPNIIFTSFGDMARVPGTDASLLNAKARGADLRLVYSPLDALQLARDNPSRQVVFFAVGFETTAPATAMAIRLARREHVNNFSMLVSHVRVPPAMEAILSSPGHRIQGFLAAGHVCTIMGYEEYLPITQRFGIPIVVTGFEPLDILQGLEACLRQLENGRAQVDNQYTRAVTLPGNQTARELLLKVFRVVARHWRGVGEIPNSGLSLTTAYAAYDAEQRFGVAEDHPDQETGCISGKVLQGIAKPVQCPHFGARCTPEHPLGAPMVSSEGACAAYFTHRRLSSVAAPRTDKLTISS
jgi:hydrogenase expression/formation protein HypD